MRPRFGAALRSGLKYPITARCHRTPAVAGINQAVGKFDIVDGGRRSVNHNPAGLETVQRELCIS
jgi:hypothetical protein